MLRSSRGRTLPEPRSGTTVSGTADGSRGHSSTPLLRMLRSNKQGGWRRDEEFPIDRVRNSSSHIRLQCPGRSAGRRVQRRAAGLPGPRRAESPCNGDLTPQPYRRNPLWTEDCGGRTLGNRTGVLQSDSPLSRATRSEQPPLRLQAVDSPMRGMQSSSWHVPC